jgi:hypothetical protein
MLMPLHYSTIEAVIMALAGSAILAIENKEYLFQEGNSFVIPALQKLTLWLNAVFKALGVMPKDSWNELVD